MSKKEAKVLPELEDKNQQMYYVRVTKISRMDVYYAYESLEALTTRINLILSEGTPRAAITIIYGKVISFKTQKTETVKEFIL